MLHEISELMKAGADLLDHLGDISGLRMGFHTCQEIGIRVLVQNGMRYTDEVGPLDWIAIALNSEVKQTSEIATMPMHDVFGSWNGMVVKATQLSGWKRDTPCTFKAMDMGRRVQAFKLLLDGSLTQSVESLAFYDQGGLPRIHAVLKTEPRLMSGAMNLMFQKFGGLQFTHEPSSNSARYGSALLEDGTVLTIASIC